MSFVAALVRSVSVIALIFAFMITAALTVSTIVAANSELLMFEVKPAVTSAAARTLTLPTILV